MTLFRSTALATLVTGGFISRLLGVVVVTASVAALAGQSRLASDIHPESLSRLPPMQRDSLDAEGKRVWDVLAAGGRGMPRTGPAPVSIYSPGAAEPIQLLNRYLRNTVVGPRYFELSALIAAREFDQQYEWSGHEPAALRAGVEQSLIDVIKFNRPIPSGLAEKDATVIRLGRALLARSQGQLRVVGKDRGALRPPGRH